MNHAGELVPSALAHSTRVDQFPLYLTEILEEAPALYVRSTASAALLRGASVSSVQADRSDAPINIGMDRIHDFVSFISSSD